MDKKIFDILKSIVNKKVVELKVLESDCSMTSRQLKYRVQKINEILKADNIKELFFDEDRLISNSKANDKFKSVIINFDNNSLYYFDKNERLTFIFLMMFIEKEYLSLVHLTSLLQVSRTTVLNNIKELTEILKKNSIDLVYDRKLGYHLSSDEFIIRNYMMRLIMNSISEENTAVLEIFIDRYRLDLYDFMRLLIEEISEDMAIKISSSKLEEFIYIFIFLKARIHNRVQNKLQNKSQNSKSEIDSVNIKKEIVFEIEKLKEYKFTEKLLSFFEKEIVFTPEEKAYFTAWIIGITIGDVEDDEPDTVKISNLVGRLMSRFQFLTGIHYTDTERIFRQIYSHLKPAYYRLLLNIPIFNPITDKIKTEYRDLYYLVSIVVKEMEEELKIIVPDAEIAYLAAHFGTIFNNDELKFTRQKKRAAVIKNEGMGTHTLLLKELSGLFPDFELYSVNYSENSINLLEDTAIIFTSVIKSSVLNNNVPVVKINTVIGARERFDLINEVQSLLGPECRIPSISKLVEIIAKHADITNEKLLTEELFEYIYPIAHKSYAEDVLMLRDMISEETVTLKMKAENWEEAIRKSGKVMVDFKAVNERYVETIIDECRINNFNFVLMPQVAVPHTKTANGALKYHIGITSLETPIVFSDSPNNPVKYIFFLSSLGKEHLNAMTQLLELFNDSEFFKVLDKAEKASEVINFINKYQYQN